MTKVYCDFCGSEVSPSDCIVTRSEMGIKVETSVPMTTVREVGSLLAAPPTIDVKVLMYFNVGERDACMPCLTRMAQRGFENAT